MSNAKVRVGGIGISFGGLLSLVFVAAKLWGKIDWPWWQVFAPLWAPPAAIFGAIAVFLVLAGLLWCIASIGEAIGRALKGRRDNGL